MKNGVRGLRGLYIQVPWMDGVLGLMQGLNNTVNASLFLVNSHAGSRLLHIFVIRVEMGACTRRGERRRDESRGVWSVCV